MVQSFFSEPAAEAGAATRLFRTMRSGAWLGRQRILAYGTILLVLEIAAFLFLIAGTHGLIAPTTEPTTTDFASFYAAGDLANAGTPHLAYDQAAHWAAEQRATEPGVRYQFFYYPPVYLLLCALLARLPYLVAYVLFEGASLALFLTVAQHILAARGWRVMVPLLAFPAVFWTLGLGQNAFLTAALFGGATLLIERRPFVAGLLFGALCYKPHFGLLVPMALVAGGHWRAVAGAALSSVGLVAASLAFFGLDAWRDFLTIAMTSPGTYENGRIQLAGIISPFAALRVIGIDTSLAYLTQLAATLAAALFVAYLWRRRVSLPVRAAALIAATLVAVPVMLLYDLMLALLAIIWLVGAARHTGFFSWEKMTFVVLFLAALVTLSTGRFFHLPLALIGDVALLAAIARRALGEIDQRRPAAVPVS
ncbi:MAG TPA: glycosyltransferase family 87 protein [Stellaceae bacterium]|nr:glycosyltransferase family 87 protein [Stellaceae bacterium]